MSQSQQTPSTKPFSNALGKASGIVVALLYTMQVHTLTIDYFIQQIRPLMNSTFNYQLLWYCWVIVVFIMLATFIRCAVIAAITLGSNLLTSLLVRLSLPKQKRR